MKIFVSSLLRFFLYFASVFFVIFLLFIFNGLYPFLIAGRDSWIDGIKYALGPSFNISLIMSIVLSTVIFAVVDVSKKPGSRYTVFFIPTIVSIFIMVPYFFLLNPSVKSIQLQKPDDLSYYFPKQSFFNYGDDYKIYISSIDKNAAIGTVVIKNGQAYIFERLSFTVLEDRIIISPIIDGEKNDLIFYSTGVGLNGVGGFNSDMDLLKYFSGFIASFYLTDHSLSRLVYFIAIIIFVMSFLSILKFDKYPLLRLTVSGVLFFVLVMGLSKWVDISGFINKSVIKVVFLKNYLISFILIIMSAVLESLRFLLYNKEIDKS